MDKSTGMYSAANTSFYQMHILFLQTNQVVLKIISRAIPYGRTNYFELCSLAALTHDKQLHLVSPQMEVHRNRWIATYDGVEATRSYVWLSLIMLTV